MSHTIYTFKIFHHLITLHHIIHGKRISIEQQKGLVDESILVSDVYSKPYIVEDRGWPCLERNVYLSSIEDVDGRFNSEALQTLKQFTRR